MNGEVLKYMKLVIIEENEYKLFQINYMNNVHNSYNGQSTNTW